ncbi:MAG: hypothetical protein EAX96_08240 [Candidatus Lokiarchaeota archaeon]|nr:hypothetical protein [Candidatus Lokiarchaeota archaeon]
MSLDFNNKTKVVDEIRFLIKQTKFGADKAVYDKLRNIIMTIGQDKKLYSTYKEIYDEIEDDLINIGFDLEQLKCDPVLKKTPTHTKTKT